MTDRPARLLSVFRVVSGGQTGVDRAALDAALALGVAVGGWCPAGRWAEDGPVPNRYPLVETATADPAERTRLNVRDSDATLVLAPGGRGGVEGGTALTVRAARTLGRPVLVVPPRPGTAGGFDTGGVVAWVRAHGARTLNVAGPRESEAPGVYAAALGAVGDTLGRLLEGRPAR
ncbi:putative molybdenum carrier protein [Rubrivirga sp. S365]|uniref:Molybdenum carrier protein n=1 Tax=Rubrivirga litoralis TaxID=3075598 RepID=A0ABU3BTW0_9BACT|nr:MULTISPECIES: putative molybdenum carrier protein [unclassified Rubrivirga]MDT0632728.1 putative molybdenum carrier protein [Rubrivirga sp. F394]MDT7856967.1 putative molybdenum carrier protein [Rubrivirga sp. S365]